MIRFVVCFALFAAALSTRVIAAPTLDEVINGIEAAEEKIHRVAVKNFEAQWFEQAGGEVEWKPTPIRYAGSAWYDLGDEQVADDWLRGRVWFDKLVLKWEQGTAPFADCPEDAAFDGESGRSIRLSVHTTKKGRVIRDNAATLSADRPTMLHNAQTRYASGIGFTTQLFLGLGGFSNPPRPRQLISRMLRDAVRNARPPAVADERVNDVDAIRLRWEIPGGQGGSTFWFDPARGYALVRYEMRVNIPQAENYEFVDVTELKEVSPGVWFPVAGSVEEPDPDPAAKRRTRMTYKAVDVLVNDAIKWDADFFAPEIPSGYMVADVRKKGRADYLMMPDGTTREMQVGDVLPVVKVEDPKQPE